MDDVNTLLQSCTSENLSERVEAYHSLTEKLSSLPQGSDWGHEISGEVAKQIISNLKEDLFNEEKDVSYEATGFLGCFLANDKLMDLLTGEEEQEILDSLIKLLEETTDRPVLTRGLWSLAQSKFECETYNKNLSRILTLIAEMLKCNPTSIIIYETLQVLKSLMESVPQEVLEKVEDWFPKIFVYLFHDAHRIRGVAYACLNFCQLYNQQKLAHLHEYIMPFIPKLKSQYCKQMKQFIEEHCTFVLKIWRLLVLILGKYLHSGTTLINGLLEVVEKAFKSPKPEFRVDAFKCWYVLIGNFSSDMAVLTQPKRLKLLIAPLKSNNAKTEDIAYIKLHTWWFLLCKGEDRIISHFDLVVSPLLKFCFNSNRISQSGVSERTLLMSGVPSPCTKYTTLLLKACEVLARILNNGHIEASCESFSLSDLPFPIMNETLFVKNSPLIFGCVADALMTLYYKDESHRKVGTIILQATIKIIVSIVETNPLKKESVELVKDLFNLYDFIELQSKPEDSLNSFTYEFLKMTIIGEFTFSQHVLHSSNYYIPVGSKVRDMMNGTLSNYFAHKLTTPGILHKAFTDTSDFLNLWETVLQKSKPANKLIFLEAVIEQLTSALPSFQAQNAEVLISLWMGVAKALDSHIKETQQINQGDNSEHDWTCVYNTLLFPLTFPEENICGISSTSYEDLMSIWNTLWYRFSSLTPLTATAEPNIEADFIARKIHSIVHERLTVGAIPPDGSGFTLAFVTDILHVVVDRFRFKEIGRKPQKMLQSPLKQRRKSHPLHNLSSIVELLSLLMEKTLFLVSHWRHKAMQKLSLSFAKLFTSISHDRFVWPTVSAVADVMKKALQINPIAKFNVDVEQKFMAMWNAFCGLIECRVVPKLTQDQLTLLSPLISVALQSSHLGLRQRTRLMWSTSFASTSLSIPEDLFDVLKGVALPPASISEMPSADSQSLSPKENIPTHISGSFLNRKKNQEFTPFASTQQELKEKLSSPLIPKSRFFTNKTLRRKDVDKSIIVSLDDLEAEDFVAISSPKPNKRVLTPHQAEKMRERRSDIPALYSDLTQSASQLPSQFISQDSFDVSTNNFPVSATNGMSSNLTFKGTVSSSPEASPRSSAKSTPTKERKDSNSRCYSDEDLAEVLRNASLEMERSFSDSIMTLDSVVNPHEKDVSSSKLQKAKTSLTYTNSIFDVTEEKHTSSRQTTHLGRKSNSHSTRRKALTPSKKSLDDIRKSLKGNTPKRSATSKVREARASRNSSHTPSRDSSKEDRGQATPPKTNSSRSDSKFSSESSPLASPLNSPVKLSYSPPVSTTRAKGPVPSPQKSAEDVSKRPSDGGYPVDSEDEIPNSQMEISKASTLLLFPFASPHRGSKTTPVSLSADPENSPLKERPRRNKRKTIFEDEKIYVMPLKRPKGSPSPVRDSPVVVLNREEFLSPFLSPTKDSHSFEEGNSSKADSKGKESEDRERSSSNRKTDLEASPKRDVTDFLVDSNVQKLESLIALSAKSLSSTPSKVTRSGRRIVAPNRDMPEPMTPPGLGVKKVAPIEELESEIASRITPSKTPSRPTAKTSVAMKSCSKVQEKTSLSLAESKDVSQKRRETREGENLAEAPVDGPDDVGKENQEGIDHKDSKDAKSGDSADNQLDSSSSNEPSKLERKQEEEDKDGVTKKEIKGRLTRKSVPVAETRHSRRISLRRKEDSKDPPYSNVKPTEQEGPATFPEKDAQLAEASSSKNSSLQSHQPKEENSSSPDVIFIKDKGQSPDREKKQAAESTLKEELKNASIIIRKVENCHVPAASLSAASSATSAIIVSSNNESKVNGVNSGWSNMSKYKVIFSPKFVKPLREGKNESKVSTLSEGMHIANGGIVFTKTHSQRKLVSENSSKESAKPPLKKSKSLEKFSPSKMSSALNISPLHLLQVSFKKVGNVSSEGGQTSVTSASQAHHGSSSENSVTKVCVKDIYDSQISSKCSLGNKMLISSEKESFHSEAAKGPQLFAMRVSPSPKKQSSSPSKSHNLFAEKIVLKGPSVSSPSKQDFTLKESQSLSPKSSCPDKADSSLPKFQLLVNRPIPLLEGANSPPHQSSTFPDSSGKVTVSTGSPKSLNVGSHQDSSNALPPRARLIISPTQKTQKIFLLSSPKSPGNSSPVQKFIYSPHTTISPININSSANETETKNHVLVLSSKIKSITEGSEPKMASSSPDKSEPPSEKGAVTASSPVKVIWSSGDKVSSLKAVNGVRQEREEMEADSETPDLDTSKSSKERSEKEKAITGDEKDGETSIKEKEEKEKEEPQLSAEIQKVDESRNALVETVSVSDIVNEERKKLTIEGTEKASAKKGKLLKKLSSKFFNNKGHKLSRRKMKHGIYGKKRPRDQPLKKATATDLSEAQQKKVKKEMLNGSTAAGNAVTNDEEAAGGKAAPDRESPDKNGSRLTTYVSTPERKKLSVRRVQVPGSRAAIMVACAKRTMRTRIDEGSEGATTLLLDEAKNEVGVNAGQSSPAITPNRKKLFYDGYPERKPWAKHEPSPGASPCGSILKKRPAEDEALPTIAAGEISDFATDGSPSSAKYRRVSFADPPVSESVEIPPSPKLQKGHKAQKRLDMTQALNSDAKDFLFDSQISQEVYKVTLDTPNCSQPLYSSLLSCSETIDVLAPFLTSPSLAESLKVVFKDRGLKTVGDFCALSEMDVESLPVYPPKTLNAIQCLKSYEEKLGRMPESHLPSEDASQVSAETLPQLPCTEADDNRLQSTNVPSPGLDLTTTVPPADRAHEDAKIEYGTDMDIEELKPIQMHTEGKSTSTITEEKNPAAIEMSTPPKDGIKECEFSRVFCQQMEGDSGTVPSFVEGLSLETRLKLFETLTAVIPYKNVIDTFHWYLLMRENTS